MNQIYYTPVHPGEVLITLPNEEEYNFVLSSILSAIRLVRDFVCFKLRKFYILCWMLFSL